MSACDELRLLSMPKAKCWHAQTPIQQTRIMYHLLGSVDVQPGRMQGHTRSMYTPWPGFVLGLSSGSMLTTDRDREARSIPVPRDKLHLIDLQAQDCIARGHDAAEAYLLLWVLDESQGRDCIASQQCHDMRVQYMIPQGCHS